MMPNNSSFYLTDLSATQLGQIADTALALVEGMRRHITPLGCSGPGKAELNGRALILEELLNPEKLPFDDVRRIFIVPQNWDAAVWADLRDIRHHFDNLMRACQWTSLSEGEPPTMRFEQLPSDGTICWPEHPLNSTDYAKIEQAARRLRKFAGAHLGAECATAAKTAADKRGVFRAPDGRVFVIPPSDPAWAGNPMGSVLDLEARTRTRLRDGGNPNWFLRLHHHFEERRDPAAGVSFAEYVRQRHHDKVDQAAPEQEPARRSEIKMGANVSVLGDNNQIVVAANNSGEIGTIANKSVTGAPQRSGVRRILEYLSLLGGASSLVANAVSLFLAFHRR